MIRPNQGLIKGEPRRGSIEGGSREPMILRRKWRTGSL